jgi:hypothetical protein
MFKDKLGFFFSDQCKLEEHVKNISRTPMLIYDINNTVRKEIKITERFIDQYNFHPEIMKTLYVDENHDKFNVIKYIGTSPLCKGQPFEKVAKDRPNFCLVGLKTLEENPELMEPMLNLMDHTPTTHVRDRYMKVLHKSDKVGIKPQNEEYGLALQFALRMLNNLKNVKGTTAIEYNPATVCGVPWTKIKDSNNKVMMHKSDFVNSPDFNTYMDMEYEPIFQGSTKHEQLPTKELIEENKQRVFYCGEVNMTFKQKIMFDPSSSVMQQSAEDYENTWSRYGFVKQYGGINRMALAHLKGGKNNTHLTSDVSGWDKLLSILEDVWRIRKKLYGSMTDKEKCWYKKMKRNLSKPFICTPDGHIYQRDCGNCSGSGTTTTDNTIAHIIIKFYLLICLFKYTYGKLPSYEEIVEFVILSLYGDDDLTSLNREDWYIGDESQWFDFLKDFVRKVYAEFGLTIKESSFKVQSTLEGLEFLGSTFVLKDGVWYGKPRYGKIVSSLLQYLEKPKTAQALCSTACAAVYLIAGMDDPESILIRRFVSKYAQVILRNFEKSLCKSEQEDLQNIVDGRFNGISLATGWEGVDNSFSNFN